MLFGGMFIQILIQAVLLQLSLKLVAKHEADTSFGKSLVVVAGLGIGQFLVAILIGKVLPLAVLPAIIVFTAAVIMTFCWISFWKSMIVVLIYLIVQVILLGLISLFIGASLLLNLIGMGSKGPQNQAGYHQIDPEEAQRMAIQAQQEAMQRHQDLIKKQAAAAEAANRGEARETAARVITNKVGPVTSPRKSARTNSRKIDWAAAEESIRRGGIVRGAKTYAAMLNGNMVSAGDTLKAEYEGRTYRWKVKSISDNDVELEEVDVK